MEIKVYAAKVRYSNNGRYEDYVCDTLILKLFLSEEKAVEFIKNYNGDMLWGNGNDGVEDVEPEEGIIRQVRQIDNTDDYPPSKYGAWWLYTYRFYISEMEVIE